MNTTPRFTLQPYTDRSSRYDCPQCGGKKKFTRYIDRVTGRHIDPLVGKCDRINNCGYHYKPREFFADHPDRRFHYSATDRAQVQEALHRIDREREEPPRLIIREQYLTESRQHPLDDHLMTWLTARFGKGQAMRLYDMYQLGTWRSGSLHSTIFWQIDTTNQIRGGKIIRYNPATGHRLKDVNPTWIHRELAEYRKRNLRLDQCLFGEHLLRPYPDKPVAVVESEKTAILCASVFPGYLWLATGGLQAFTPERLQVLKGRAILAFPDLKGYHAWYEKACQSNLNIRLFRHLERLAPENDREEGLDVGDYVV